MTAQTKLGNFPSEDAPSYASLLQCMRCGFCLPHCPTYALTDRERSGPRGRVALARAVAENRFEVTPALKEEAYFCLDCRACTTACPSGVHAGLVMEHCRSQVQQAFPAKGLAKKFRQFVLEKMLPSPELLETSMLPARLYQRLGLQWLVRNSNLLKLGPGWMDKVEGLLPKLEVPLRQSLPEVVPARGEQRGRVGFFLGCVMSLMYAEVSRQTVRVLSHQGYEVITPSDQKCCGAPHLSEGDRDTARVLGMHNLELFMQLEVDMIVTDCAGCGAALKDYEELLESKSEHGKLAAFRAKVRDISEFLAEVGVRQDGLKPVKRTVTYHEPCHLAHAQQITAAPRTILQALPGVELREMEEANWCCGSAATFGLKHLDESRKILDRKLQNVADTGAEVLVTANPGCQLQLDWGVREEALPQRVMHIMELFGEALPD